MTSICIKETKIWKLGCRYKQRNFLLTQVIFARNYFHVDRIILHWINPLETENLYRNVTIRCRVK